MIVKKYKDNSATIITFHLSVAVSSLSLRSFSSFSRAATCLVKASMLLWLLIRHEQTLELLKKSESIREMLFFSPKVISYNYTTRGEMKFLPGSFT